jgi:hypothetical protein
LIKNSGIIKNLLVICRLPAMTDMKIKCLMWCYTLHNIIQIQHLGVKNITMAVPNNFQRNPKPQITPDYISVELKSKFSTMPY